MKDSMLLPCSCTILSYSARRARRISTSSGTSDAASLGDEDGDSDSSVDEWASAAQFAATSSGEEETDDSEDSLPPGDLLAQQLAARRGALATVSKDEESVRLRDQEVKAERAAEQREAKRKAKQADGATETKEWDKVVHTRTDFNKATPDF
eukprot:COSAG02_NODE_7803_length_2839_cov_1.781022_4_plen_152_part_00